MWHGQHYMVHYAWPPRAKVAALISRHEDGEINAIILRHLGVEPIRGSGGKGAVKTRMHGGAAALRDMARRLADGRTVVMTADVPKVSRRAGLGIVTLARLTGRPIYPIAVVTSRRFDFRSWDRASLGKPFGRGAMVLGASRSGSRRDADEAALGARAPRRRERSSNEVHRRAYGLGRNARIRDGPLIRAAWTVRRHRTRLAPDRASVSRRSVTSLLFDDSTAASTTLVEARGPEIPAAAAAPAAGQGGCGRAWASGSGHRPGEVLARPARWCGCTAPASAKASALLPLVDRPAQGPRLARSWSRPEPSPAAGVHGEPAPVRASVHQFVPLDVYLVRCGGSSTTGPPTSCFVAESELWPNMIARDRPGRHRAARARSMPGSRSARFERWTPRTRRFVGAHAAAGRRSASCQTAGRCRPR